MPNKPILPGETRKQIAALPIRIRSDGQPEVLLITSRETQRFIIPKGWAMKGKKDYEAAAIEAKQEAGVVGEIHKKAIGSYEAWKRLSDHFDLCCVEVFLLEFKRQLPKWDEKGQRRAAWLTIEEAATLIDEPGLITIIQELPNTMPKHLRKSSAMKASSA